jgi:hypothetical protein
MSYHEGSNWQAKKEDEGKPLYDNRKQNTPSTSHQKEAGASAVEILQENNIKVSYAPDDGDLVITKIIDDAIVNLVFNKDSNEGCFSYITKKGKDLFIHFPATSTPPVAVEGAGVSEFGKAMMLLGDAHTMLARTPMDKDDYNPISALLAEAKNILFKILNSTEYGKPTTTPKIEEGLTAEEVLSKRIVEFPSEGDMTHEAIKRNVLAAMEEYKALPAASKGDAVPYLLYENDKVNSILSVCLQRLDNEQLCVLRDCLIERTPSKGEGLSA